MTLSRSNFLYIISAVVVLITGLIVLKEQYSDATQIQGTWVYKNDANWSITFKNNGTCDWNSPDGPSGTYYYELTKKEEEDAVTARVGILRILAFCL